MDRIRLHKADGWNESKKRECIAGHVRNARNANHVMITYRVDDPKPLRWIREMSMIRAKELKRAVLVD